MMTTIALCSAGTFPASPVTLSDLKTINYFYGANGSGKTTISRVIDCIANHAGCSITWDKNTPLQAFVYNRDFVDRNFAGDLKGVFTLGEENLLLKADIEKKKKDIETLTADKQKLAYSLGEESGFAGKVGELSTLKTSFAESCWQHKVKHEAKLASAFKGSMGSKDDFRNQLVKTASAGKGETLTLEEIETRASTAFNSSAATEAALTPLNGSTLLGYAADPVLSKVVVGRTDIDIAALINQMAISDWVHTGQAHFTKCKPKCPFCQQNAPADLETKLNAYFDSSFAEACASIETLLAKYEAEMQRVKHAVGTLVSSPSPRIDLDQLRADQQTLVALLNGNVSKLRTKQKEPSTVVALDEIEPAVASINAMLEAANTEIRKHNAMVADLPKQKAALIDAVWRHLWDVELKSELATYKKKRDGLENAIAALKKKIVEKDGLLATANKDLRDLEQKITSVAPTMKAMNDLLRSFHFTTFALREGATPGTYELVRSNGQPAKDTLSDGEKTFLTFLYFYHLVKGSHDATGTTTKRVVVVDDPVSSLDSDVLFVVSSLLKNLFSDARDAAGQIAQVFALTHNIYFHKEMTFDTKRQGDKPKADESFWIVRRDGAASCVERCQTNPVKSSYELLWADVRNPNPPQLTICNTLRRIIENYFKLLGGIDPHTLHEKFEGEEKTICRSLVSWINDGSHFGMEDLHLSQTPATVQKYLVVFRRVFETQGHEAHYRMMMG